MGVQDHPRWLELSDGVNTVTLTLYEALQYTQTYENIGGNSVLRMLDGAAVKQTNWSKLSTTISGSGGLPLGFSELNFDGFLTLKCGAPRAVSSTSNAITLPNELRSDIGYTPTARKRVDGFFVPTLPPVITNPAGETLATVPVDATADAYMVLYYPEILVVMNNPSDSFDWGEASSNFNITAEQA